ncbi:MAG TPA: carboxypeptidase-like regulatory domain-containing protein, partial [Bryobacteraceae bacterium]|nr:carboxypeptidase-like regulatory domain-containing protein [Bryobacteraceae bacterium]
YILQATAVYGDKLFFVSEEVTVGSSGIANLALTLLPSIELTGSVRLKSSSGQRARVRLDLDPASGSVEWNEAGDSFIISSVLQRKYRLGIIPLKDDGDGTVDFYVKSVRMGNQDIQRKEFSVVGGAAPIDIVLADDTGTLAGTVTDAGGNPVSSRVWVSQQGVLVLGFSSDNEGRIRPIKVPPGEYVVYAADAMQRDPPEGASDVEVPPSGSVNVSLKRVERQ